MDRQRQNKESCPTTVTRPGSSLQSSFGLLLSLKRTKISKFSNSENVVEVVEVAMLVLFELVRHVWPCQVAAALASPQGLASEAHDKAEHEPCKLSELS